MPLSSSLWTRSLSALRTLLPLGFIAASSLSCVQTQQGRDVGVSRLAVASHIQTSYDTSGSTISEILGSTPSSGNLLVAVASSDDNATISTPSGYSVAVSSLSAAPYQVIYYKEVTNPSSDKDISMSVGGGHWHLQFMEFSGLDAKQAPTVATAKRSTVTASSTFTFNSVTTTAPNAMVLATIAHKASSLSADYSSWGSSFSETGAGSYGNGGHASAFVNASTAGTYTPSVVVDRAGSALGHTLIFYKAPNPGTDLAVSAGVGKNTLTFVAPDLPVTHALIVAKTADCSFTGTPTGSEAKGATVGNSVVIFNDSLTANLATTNVTVASATTTVTYTASTGALVHNSLTAGTVYCYKLFVRNNSTLDDNSLSGRPTRSGTPTNSATTNPTFVLSQGTTALSATSILPGSGAYYADNAGKILSAGSDGVRLFEPYQLADAVQSRGPVGTLTGDTDSTLFLSSLDGDAYAIWASGSSKGSVRWSTAAIDGNSSSGGDQALATDLYAAPLVSNSLSRVFIATRNAAATENRVFSVNATTGACQWVFNGTCVGATTSLNVGQIASVPILDPTNYRMFFTSAAFTGGSSTVWALDPRDTPSGSRVLWQKDYGAAVASPAFTDINRTAILVGTSAGRIYKLNPSTGLTCWGGTTDGCGTATGLDSYFCTNTSTNARSTSCTGSAVQKGIVATAEPYAGYFLVTTADGNVRLIDSSTGVQQWRTTITGASAPLLLQGIGSGYVYVGSSTGVVYELALTTGTQTGTRSVGGGSVVVGDPAYDGTNQKLYVSTSGGNLYAFSVPF